jgi:hypothetical protein
MTSQELKDKIKSLVKSSYNNTPSKTKDVIEYDEITKFPELRSVIVDLLSTDFEVFLESIDWVSPRPTTFRINLKNNQNFLLIYTERSWIAKVEGKKYYLLNVDEEERAAFSISRILSYGEKTEGNGDVDLGNEEEQNDVSPTNDDEDGGDDA